LGWLGLLKRSDVLREVLLALAREECYQQRI
jgi:hypothetical protein